MKTVHSIKGVLCALVKSLNSSEIKKAERIMNEYFTNKNK